MVTAPVHTPARFHTPPPLVHLARYPYDKAYCGKPRNGEFKPDAVPTCVVCLAMYEARRGRPWGGR